MIQINLGKLKSEAENIVSMLNEKTGISPKLEGNKILIEDEGKSVKTKDVKTYLKKYLHHEGLRKQTRILVEKNEINLVELKLEEE